jgi:glycolate oxidase iron-sulfur subunit
VAYARLADIGRAHIERQVKRPLNERLMRLILRKLVPYPERFAFLLALGRLTRPFLPSRVKAQIPAPQQAGSLPKGKHRRQMLVLEGCAQKAATPGTHAATARLLDRLNISLISEPRAGCCGAVDHHLSAEQPALAAMRRNIDAWWSHIEAGAEAIVITASGCGAVVKEYGHLLRNDPRYAEKAMRVAELAKDIGEILADEDLSALGIDGENRPIAFHAPCTLQHGQKLPGLVEEILRKLNYRLTPVTDSHLCCGSAGTYSILQPALSKQLLTQKLTHLCAGAPEMIATANVGCQLHLATQSSLPVRHWIELLDEALNR